PNISLGRSAALPRPGIALCLAASAFVMVLVASSTIQNALLPEAVSAFPRMARSRSYAATDGGMMIMVFLLMVTRWRGLSECLAGVHVPLQRRLKSGLLLRAIGVFSSRYVVVECFDLPAGDDRGAIC